MEFYLSIDGRKEGPFSTFKVDEFLDDGRITPDTLGWHRDLEGWKPVREITALDGVMVGREPRPETSGEESKEEKNRAITARVPPPLPDPEGEDDESERVETAAAAEKPAATSGPKHEKEIRPFVRFWARMFDYTLVSVVVFLVSDVSFARPTPDESFADMMSRYLEQMQTPEARALARTQFFSLVGWHLVETVLIHLFGTTPGKALLGIRIAASDGSRVPMLRSLGRSFYVYVLGAGFYQVPFILIGMTFSFFRLMATGKCLWDQHLDIRVENPKPGLARIGLVIGAFMVLFILQSLKFT